MQLPKPLLRLMVVMMKYMTRYLPLIAHPVIAWVARNEVIACGLRTDSGEVHVIFTPTPTRGSHSTVRLRPGDEELREMVRSADFAAGVVEQHGVPGAKIGDVLQVRAEDSRSKRLYRSPYIHVKQHTVMNNSALKAMVSGTQVKFAWDVASSLEPMIFFLAVMEVAGKTLAGIYTRETSWMYPFTARASLSVGPADVPGLIPDQSYRARLVVVDYDGWVSLLAEQEFTI